MDTAAAGTTEFKTVLKACRLVMPTSKVPWKALYKHLPEEPDTFDDLMTLDVKPLMDNLEKVNAENNNCFGYLPLMASCSKCQLGALNSQSFAERINSVANLIVTVTRGDLDPVLVNKLVMLRMNKTFMEFLCARKCGGNINIIRGIDEIDNENNNRWS